MVVDVGEVRGDRVGAADPRRAARAGRSGPGVVALVLRLGVDDEAVGAAGDGLRRRGRLAAGIGAVDVLPGAHAESGGLEARDQRGRELAPEVRPVGPLDEHRLDVGRARPGDRSRGRSRPPAPRQLPDPHALTGEHPGPRARPRRRGPPRRTIVTRREARETGRPLTQSRSRPLTALLGTCTSRRPAERRPGAHPARPARTHRELHVRGGRETGSVDAQPTLGRRAEPGAVDGPAVDRADAGRGRPRRGGRIDRGERERQRAEHGDARQRATASSGEDPGRHASPAQTRRWGQSCAPRPECLVADAAASAGRSTRAGSAVGHAAPSPDPAEGDRSVRSPAPPGHARSEQRRERRWFVASVRVLIDPISAATSPPRDRSSIPCQQATQPPGGTTRLPRPGRPPTAAGRPGARDVRQADLRDLRGRPRRYTPIMRATPSLV